MKRFLKRNSQPFNYVVTDYDSRIGWQKFRDGSIVNAESIASVAQLFTWTE